MKLYELLNVYDDGENSYTILPYCEEYTEGLDSLKLEPWFSEIESREVKRIVTIGGGCYKVETCIELEEDNEDEDNENEDEHDDRYKTSFNRMIKLCVEFQELCKDLAHIPAEMRNEFVKELMAVPCNYPQELFIKTAIETEYGYEFWKGVNS